MKIKKYFREVVQEIKKVTWPSKKQTINMTSLVIGVSVVVALYLAGLDYFFQKLISSII